MAAKIKWNRKAWREIRNDPRVEADLVARGQRIAAACGPGFGVNVSDSSRTRARVYVQAESFAAVKKNASENTLLMNLDAGR